MSSIHSDLVQYPELKGLFKFSHSVKCSNLGVMERERFEFEIIGILFSVVFAYICCFRAFELAAQFSDS